MEELGSKTEVFNGWLQLCVRQKAGLRSGRI